MWFKRKRAAYRRASLPVRRLAAAIEAVEPRTLLSNIAVTTFDDIVDENDGQTSLREAILQANASSEADSITLQAGTYQLTIDGAGEDAGMTGDLDVLGEVSFLVSGGRAVINAAGISDRVLHVINGSDTFMDVTIRDVTLSGGNSVESGGGLYNDGGTVTLIGGGLSDNRATISEGAYVNTNGGLVQFVNSPLTNNAIGGTDDKALIDGVKDLVRNNRQELTDGIDEIFGTLIGALDTGISRLDLPLIGDKVREGLQPMFDGLEAFRTQTIDFLNDVLAAATAEGTPPIQELLQSALYVALGPEGGFDRLAATIQPYLAPYRNQYQLLGLNLLQDNSDTGSDIGPEDILVTIGEDGDGYRWIEVGFHIGQRALVTLPGFDLGLSSVAQYINDPAAAAQLANFLDAFDFNITSSTGLRVDARWDMRLGFGMSELPAHQFYLNGGATTNGLPDGTPVEELKISVDVFAAPASDSESFAQQFEDVVTTPNLTAEVPLGLLQALISDGTPGAVQITTPVGLPTSTSENLQVDFTIIIDGDESDPIHIAFDFGQPLTELSIPALLLALNSAIIAETGELFPPISFTLDFSPIDSFFNPGVRTTPFLVLNARYPEINHLEIRGADELGYLDTQYENRRVLGMGFENNGVSSLQNGNQVLTAVLPPPAEGISVEDPSFTVWIGGQRINGYTEGATAILVSFREILNRDIGTLEALRSKLESLLRELIAADTNYDASKFHLNITADGLFQLVAEAGADPNDADAPLLTVTYRAVDQSKITFTASVDITDPGFNESFLKDYRNYQINFNRVTRENVAENEIQDVFVPTLKAEAELRFHVDANADHLSGFIEQATGLSDGAIGLPRVDFDLKIDASLDITNLFKEAGQDGDTPSVFSIDTFQFDNITLDVADFLETVIAPIAEMVVDALAPLFSIIGDSADDPEAFFNQRIPVISDMANRDITVGDILEATGLREAVEEILEVADDLNHLGDRILEYIHSDEFLNDLTDNGRFTFGGLELVMDPDSPLYFPRTKVPVPIDLKSIYDSTQSLSADNFMRSYATSFTIAPPGFNIDLFSPTTVFNMLTGQPFNIVSFGLPTIDADAGFDFDLDLSILSLAIEASATFDTNLRFVYDSAGLEKIVNAARSGAEIDWTDLIDGFAIQNNPDGYEIGGSVSFFGETTIGTDDLNAHVLIDIFVELGLELHDPNSDGKLRIDEILDITDDFSDPTALFCIFDILGAASFEIEGSAEAFGADVSGSLGLSTGEFSLQDLLSSLFGICEEDTTPILAEEVVIDGETVLRLNTGAFSSGRLYGDVDDSAPDPITYIVENADGSVTIFDRGGEELTFTYENGEYVAPDGDTSTLERIGDHYVRTARTGFTWTFDSQNRLSVAKNGLFGEVRYSYLATGELSKIEHVNVAGDIFLTEDFFQNVNVRVWTDANGVHISGYDVDDQVYSGTYARIIASGSSADDILDFSGVVGIDVELRGLGGDDTLLGGSANDLLDGGSGDDTIAGNAGNDVILAGTGSNTVTDGAGNDSIDLSLNALGVTLTTGGGNDEVIGSNYDDVITAGGSGGNVRFVGGRGHDQLTGGGGNDELIGDSGDDRIFGNGGNDQLLGGIGDDHLEGGAGNDSLDGGSDDDVLIGGTGADRLLAGQGDDTLTAGLDDTWVDGGTGNDSLTFRMNERAHTATLDAYAYRVGGGTTTLYVNVETLDVVLSNEEGLTNTGNDTLRIDGVVLPLTTIAAGTGNDHIIIVSFPGLATPTVINLGGGDDTLTVRNTTRKLTVDGSGSVANGDTVVIDRSADLVSRTGTMTATQFVGLGFAAIDYAGFEHVEVKLGRGHDRYLIADTPAGAETTVSGGPGDDRIRVARVSDKTAVSGDAGDDHVLLIIPATPSAALGRFDDLTFNNGVEKLFIDASQTQVPAFWTYDAAGGGAVVYLGGVSNQNRLVDTLGVATSVINGGSATNDSLVVQDLLNVPQVVTIDGQIVPVTNGDGPDYIGVAGDRIHIREGANVVSQTGSASFTRFTIGQIVDGLDGVSSSVVSPDGKHLYATGYLDDAVVAFRRLNDGTLAVVQTLKDGALGVDGLNGATDVAITSDGKHVYVTSDLDQSVAVFERVAATGRLVYRSKFAAGQPVTAVVIAPGNTFVYAAVGSTLCAYSRNSATGGLTFLTAVNLVPNATATDLAIDADGTDLMVTTAAGLRRVVLTGGVPTSVQSPNLHNVPSTGVAISGVYAYVTFDGGIHRYLLGSSSLTYVDTVYVDNVTNLAEGISIAVSPNLVQVATSFDTTSVNSSPTTRRIRLYSLKVVNEQGLDLDGIDDVFVKVDGDTVYGSTEVDEGEFAPNFFGSYDALYSGSIEIETWEDSLINEKIGGTYTVDAGKGTGIYTVRFIDELADITVAEYELKYEIYDVTPSTPTIEPLVTYFRDPLTGSLSLRTYRGVPLVSQLESLTYSPDSAYLYGTSFSTDRIVIGNPGYVSSVGEGDNQTTSAVPITSNLPDDVRTVLSSDGQFGYSISSKYGVLTVHSMTSTGSYRAESVQDLSLGLVAGSSLVLSANGNQLYVTNPVEDSILVFNRNATTGELTLAQVLTDGLNGVDGLEGVTDIAVSADGNFVYAAGTGENAIAVFARSGAGTLTYGSRFTHTNLSTPAKLALTGTSSAQFLYAASPGNDSLLVLARNATTGALSFVQAVTDNASGVDGLAGISDIAFSPDESFAYVAGRDDDSIAIFQRNSVTGGLTYVGRVQEGVDGVRGLAAVARVIVSGEYVFAAGPEALLAFARDAATGQLTLLQRLRDGSAGVDGIELVTDLDLNAGGTILYVSSGGRAAGAGGVASFDIVQMLPPPNFYEVLQSGMESLVSTTAGGSDTVIVGRVNVPTLTLNTGAESDAVTIGQARGITTVNLGADEDYASVLSTQDGASTSVYGENGDDDLAIYATGRNATTVVSGGNDNDIIRITGGRLGSQVTVHGDAPNFGDNPAPNPGDTLVFDAHGQETNPVAPQPSMGTVHMAIRSFGVDYATIENIQIIGSPLAHAGGPYTISEGNSLTLDGAQSLIPSGHSNVTFQWSLAGSSPINGLSPTLTWNELVALGIDDNGTYIVSLTVRSELNGTTYEDIATAEVTVQNTAPTLVLTGPSQAELGSVYSLDLSSSDPGDDLIERWIINWGDGTEETYYTSGGTVQHTFAATGSHTIVATAYDEDGGPYTAVTKLLTVTASRSISGAATVNEGSNYQLTLNNPAGATIANWTIHWGDGTESTVAGSTTTVSHIYADNGSYRIWASTTDATGASRDQIGPVDVLVLNVAPAITHFSVSQPVGQGQATSVLANASDPGADTIVYEFDLDGDSIFETTSTTGAISHAFLKTGMVTIAVRAKDDDGAYSAVERLTIDVVNGDPTIDRVTPDTAFEATPVLFRVAAHDPGETEDALTYEFDFDLDGIWDVTTTAAAARYTFADDGTYTIRVRVTDQNGGSDVVEHQVVVANLPPNFTPAYTVGRPDEGTPVTVHIAASDPAGDLDPLTYEFDFDNDGIYEITSNIGEATHTFADDGTYIVGIRITDDEGGFVTTSLTINVYNVAPTIALSGDDCIEESLTYTLVLGDVTDPGTDTVSKYIVYWGDGTSSEYTSQGAVNHIYDNVVGPKTIRVFLVDEDGTHPLAGEHTVMVTGAVVIDGTLFVVGCEDDDLVTVNDTDDGSIRVHATFLPDGNYKDFDAASIRQIVIYTHGGDDHVTIAGNIQLPAIINGGDGNDHLNGGGGPTVLLGGAGNDVLIGSGRRDILVGGTGEDELRAGSGEDLLIGGSIAFDRDLSQVPVLERILAEWTSERSLEERMANLAAGSGPILNGSDCLQTTGADQTIFDDEEHDRLFGNADTDWLILGIGDDDYASKDDVLV